MFCGLPILNHFNSKSDIVRYLNKNGYFWDFCNNADNEISDEEVVERSLLYLEFEDIEQLFNIFGKDYCKSVFEKNLENRKSSYNNIIIELLRTLFFNKNGEE